MDWRGSNFTIGGIRLNVNVNVKKKYGSRFYKFLTIVSVFVAGFIFLYKLVEAEE
ncbi:MAG: hypothetical protein WBA54_13815 [Acidaminobacteraceae bacterium]